MLVEKVVSRKLFWQCYYSFTPNHSLMHILHILWSSWTTYISRRYLGGSGCWWASQVTPKAARIVRCILQISSMILRMCAVKKLACRTALYVCVTSLNNFKGLKNEFLGIVQPNFTTPGCAKHGSTLEVFKNYVLSSPPFCVHAVCDVIRTSATWAHVRPKQEGISSWCLTGNTIWTQMV